MIDMLPFDLDRLCLRLLRLADLEAFLAYRSDPVVAMYQGWEPMSHSDAIEFLESQGSHTCLDPGVWLQIGIADRNSDVLIGDIGLCLSPDRTGIEFGISISSAHQCQGFGTECVCGLTGLLRSTLPFAEIRAWTDVRNLSCIAALRKAGMLHSGNRETFFKGENCSELLFVTRTD